MKSVLRIFAIALAVIGLGLVMAYFAGFTSDKLPTETTAPVLAPLDGRQLASVEARSEPVIASAMATIRAKQEVAVAPRITGVINAVHARPGDAVAAGQVVAEIDARALTAQLAQAREVAVAAQAQLTEARNAHQRRRELFARGAVSRAELDAAVAAMETASAQLTRAQRATDEVATAVSYAIIKAPVSGRVIERYADPGDTAVPAQPLLRIYDPAVMRVEAYVRESLAARLSPGDRISVRIDALQRDVAATVDEVVPAADPGSRAVLIKGVFKTEGAVYPGMFARIAIPSGLVRRLYVPASAVWSVGQLEYVRVMTADGTARRLVRTGRHGADGRVEIRSGLDAGEQVVKNAADSS